MNVFLFCIMAQIIEASSEVQASSGGTHCREAEQRELGVTGEGLHQLSLCSCPGSLIRQLTAGYHRKTGDLGVFQRTTNNLGDTVAGPMYSQLHLKVRILPDSL